MHEFPIPLAGIVSRFNAAESTDPRDMRIVGDWDAQSTPQGRTLRNEPKHEGLAYMDCHIADFATLVRLLDERKRGPAEPLGH